LQTTNYTYPTRVGFALNLGHGEKFALIFHPQDQQAGISVDIRSVAKDCFVSVDDNQDLVATSSTAPAKKFLIVPAD
jgi:hypothetical protein